MFLACVWVFSGTSKIIDFQSFSTTVGTHAVIPDEWLDLIRLIPPIEIGLGVWLASQIRRQDGSTGIPAWISLIMIGVFSVYLFVVPDAVIEKIGCGCHGRVFHRVVSGVGLGTKFGTLLFNAVLATMHVPLVADRIARRRRTDLGQKL
ncbi:MAG: hypothetical protein K8E66_10890 [Phycisphaerales bacterium]|nr:hypothetical protein [Phycisphaerales bacterium]